MATHPESEVDKHLKKLTGGSGSGFSVSGRTVTIGSINLSPDQFLDLERGMEQQKLVPTLVAGALTFVTRS